MCEGVWRCGRPSCQAGAEAVRRTCVRAHGGIVRRCCEAWQRCKQLWEVVLRGGVKGRCCEASLGGGVGRQRCEASLGGGVLHGGVA
eukprot:364456-Chlamydomonas_euryale.AAC.9